MKHLAALVMIISLTACSGGGSSSVSSLNPFNWFGGGRNADTAPASIAPRRGYTIVPDTRGLISAIASVSIDRTPRGAIVRATGTPNAPGYYDADLVVVPSTSANELSFEFRVRGPAKATGRASPIVAATYLTNSQLISVRRIRVISQTNSVTARR